MGTRIFAGTIAVDGTEQSVSGRGNGLISSVMGTLREAFGVELPSGELETIGGLVAHEMGHVPKRGESHVLQGLQFVVLLTRGGAVRWFKVSPVAA